MLGNKKKVKKRKMLLAEGAFLEMFEEKKRKLLVKM
jgi:hypothetical protein